MPARNSVKIYLENTYYHVYNRGVEERNIFKEDQDYKVFLSFLKRYLSNANSKQIITKAHNEVRPRWKIDLHKKLSLVAYCLMPNHFHFLIKQTEKDGITVFMRALMNSYVRYFNQKYKRVGGLFQGKFKAVYINDESYLLHLTRYIHLNPLELSVMTKNKLKDYYSSYGEYIGIRKTSWIYPDEILSYFGSKLNPYFKDTISYKRFIEAYTNGTKELLGNLTLE